VNFFGALLQYLKNYFYECGKVLFCIVTELCDLVNLTNNRLELVLFQATENCRPQRNRRGLTTWFKTQFFLWT